MYKVFVNDLPLLIAQNVPKDIGSKDMLIHLPTAVDILRAVDWLENGRADNVWLCGDIFQIWKQLASIGKWIHAAGGVVFNSHGDLLMIHRLGRWDLPKGKCEKGESVRDSAVREVQEECGIQQLSICRELHSTYHIYRQNDTLYIKRTFWFEMVSSDEELTPQTEEGITQVRWIDASEREKNLQNSYEAIKWLMKTRKD